jgi:precorrin-3B C17-methyltransferase / cobalt-factor III methyltransferase
MNDKIKAGKIYAIGIGPGAPDLLAPRAKLIIEKADVIVGYSTYLNQIKDISQGKNIVSSGMTGEVERCQKALDYALSGETVAVISSGDAGIYGMAGLLFELTEFQNLTLEIEIVPGITAATAANAILGAPLMNDFAVISLSDLLTPQEDIRHRIAKVAEADLVCILYNPASKKRKMLLPESLEKFCEIRSSDCICGMVKNATRENQEVWTGTLESFPVNSADMSTVIIIGNSKTVLKNGKIYTKRGYEI